LKVKVEIYNNLIKEVLPIEFKEEYLSINEVEKRISWADKLFETAIHDFENKVTQLKQTQTNLEKYIDFMMEFKNAANAKGSAATYLPNFNYEEYYSSEEFKSKA